ncbi:MAG: hypothetical protein OJI67_20960, partial [Prosthecobacter sp.]|nr:hypothetical protein [Prosthecobacter sp.]
MDKLPEPFVENVEMNPYAPPQAEVVSVLQERDLSEAYATASKVKRFFNWLIDRLMIMGMSFAFGFLLALADELGILLGGLDFLESMGRFQGYVLAAIFTVLYYWPTEFFFGRTL